MAAITLEQTLEQIHKKHGAHSINRGSDRVIEDIAVIPSGNIALDQALGVWGFPRGRVIEIYGPESAGKTTITLHAVAEAQKLGETVAFIDAEHALDPHYAVAIGVDWDALLISQPDNGEQALEIALDLIKSGTVALIVIDSVAALTPRAEIAGDIGDTHVGLQARLMSQSLRMMTSAAEKSGTTVFFVNQLREKIGVMFGSPETTPGGRALKFYATQRLDIRRKDKIKDGVEIIGNKTVVKVVKNKVAPPFTEAEFDIFYGEGMSTEGSLLDFAVEYEVIKKNGAFYYDWNGDLIGQGKEKARLTLKEDPARVAEMYERVTDKIFGDLDAEKLD